MGATQEALSMTDMRWKTGFIISLIALSLGLSGCGTEPGRVGTDSVFTIQTKQAARIEVQLIPAVLPADGVSRASVVARVFDDEGNLAPQGIEVTFSTQGGINVDEFGSIIETGDSQFGVASSSFTAGSRTGSFDIVVSSGRATGTARMTLVAPTRATITGSVTQNPSSTTVLDITANVLKPNIPVSITAIDENGVSLGTILPPSITSDNSGIARAQLFFAALTAQQEQSGVKGFIQITAETDTTFVPFSVGGQGSNAFGGPGATAPVFPNAVTFSPATLRHAVQNGATLAVPFKATFPAGAVGGTAVFSVNPPFGSTQASGINGFFVPANQTVTIAADGTASTTIVIQNIQTAQIASGLVLSVNVASTVVDSNGVPFQYAGSAPITLLPPVPALSLLSLSTNPTRVSIPAGGNFSSTLTARVQAQDGSFPAGVFVNFTSDQSQGILFPTTVATDINGIAQATFSMNSVPSDLLQNGLFVTLQATIPGVGSATDLSQTTAVFVSPAFGAPDHLILSSSVNPNPTTATVFVQGSVFPTVSQVTFDVLDINDNVARSATDRVEFVLLNGGLHGGETLEPSAGTAATTGAQIVNGRASTVLRSGIRAGTVRVIAFIDNLINNGRPDPGEPRSEPITISLSGGLPAGQNLSIVPNLLNVAGLIQAGIQDLITAYLADRFNNPVISGTRVSFTSFDAVNLDSAARITANTATAQDNSQATGTLVSQEPTPNDGFVGVQVQTNSGTDATVLVLEQDPARPNLVYAGSDGGGVYRGNFSPSGFLPFGNMAWQNVGTGLTGLQNGYIRDLAADPRAGLNGVVYAGTERGLFRSTGGGGIWLDRSGRGRISNETPAPDGGGNPAIFVLTFPAFTSRSRTVVLDNGVRRFDFVFDSATRIRFLGTTGLPSPAAATLRVSYDYEQGIPDLVPVTSVVVSRNSAAPASADNGIVYAGTLGAGVFRSTNGGFTWIGINSGLTDTNVVSLALARMPGNTADVVLLAGTQSGGVFKLRGGAPAAAARAFRVVAETSISDANAVSQLTWEAASSNLTATHILSLTTDPDRPVNDGTPFRVYAGTDVGGVFRTDGTNLFDAAGSALNWSEAVRNVTSTNLSNTRVTALAVDPATRHVFAATLDDDDPINPKGGLFRSTDGGSLFFAIGNALAGGASPLQSTRLHSLSVGGSNLWVGGDGRQVWLSRNASDPTTANVTFTEAATIGSLGSSAITVNPELDNNIYDVSKVLFSGFPQVVITPLDSATDIGVGGFQTFLVTVSDINGNPLPGNTDICITSSPQGQVSAGGSAGVNCPSVSGSVAGITVPDSLRGNTDFSFTVGNDIFAEDDINVNDTAAVVRVTATVKDPNGTILAEGQDAIGRTLLAQRALVINHVSPPTSANTGETFVIANGTGPFLVSELSGRPIVDGSGNPVTPSTLLATSVFTVTTGGSGTTLNLSVFDTGANKSATLTKAVPGP